MVDKRLNIIQFPKTPNKQQFVNFVKGEFTPEDLVQKDGINLTETEMRIALASSIYDLLFIKRVDIANQLMGTLIIDARHILERIKDEYSELGTFITKLQSGTSRNLFGNEDIIQKGKIAKDKGLEPLAEIFMQTALGEEEMLLETKKFLKEIGRQMGDPLANMQEVEEAIQGVKDILLASTIDTLEEEIDDNKKREIKRNRDKINPIQIREKMLSFQKESLFDLLSKDPDSICDQMIREPFLSYIEENLGYQDAKYIRDNFSVHKNMESKIILLTDKDINYTIFENKYVGIFYTFIKSISRRFGGYRITEKGNRQENTLGNNSRNTEHKGDIISDTPLQHHLDNFIGDKIKETTKDLVLRGKNIYIEGKLGSGKTHLLQGLVKEIHQIKPKEDIIYMTGLEFYNKYQHYSNEYRKSKEKENKEKKGNEGGRKENKGYQPSFTDRFINKILVIDGIDPIFSGNRLKSQETLLAALLSAKQSIISGRQSILKLVISRETGPIKISDEMRNLELIETGEQKDQVKRAIIQNIFTEFSNLFTENLPLEGITNILIDHIPSSDYRMILTGYLRAVDLQEGDPMSIKTYIEKKLDKRDGLKLPAEDIIQTIHELLVRDDTIRKNINENIPGIMWYEIDGARPSELIERIEENNIKSESTLGLFMELITYFINKEHPEFTHTEIGGIIGKSSTGAILRSAERRKAENLRLFKTIEKGLTQVLYKKYGISEKK